MGVCAFVYVLVMRQHDRKRSFLWVLCAPLPIHSLFFVCSVRVMHWVELGLYTGGKHRPQVISFHLALSLGLTQHAHTVHKCIYIQIKSITFSLTST